MPKFKPHLVEKKPRQTADFRECEWKCKTNKEWVTLREKIWDETNGIKGFSTEMTENFKTLHDSLLRLGDGVKKDERNGYQMREMEERIVGYGVFMGSSNRLDDRVKKDERNGYQMREREKRTIG